MIYMFVAMLMLIFYLLIFISYQDYKYFSFYENHIFSIKDCSEDFYLKKQNSSKTITYYYNSSGQFHRLCGPAIEWSDGNKSYYLFDIHYMNYCKQSGYCMINNSILKFNEDLYFYIKKNIKDLILEYNPKIYLYKLSKEEINQLPPWLKDLIIL